MQPEELMILKEIEGKDLSIDGRGLGLPQAEGWNHNRDEDPYATEEIEIEEMAIDGICGVY